MGTLARLGDCAPLERPAIARMARALTLGLAVLMAGCFTSARQNARVEPGGSVSFTFGGLYATAGVDEEGEETDDAGGGLLAEFDLQYGWGDDDGALALRLRIPFNLLLTSVDIYGQFPVLGDGLYLGAGVDLGAMPGGYVVMTRYFGRNYLSLTGRVLLRDPYPNKAGYEMTLNPQISLGRLENADIRAFIGYYQMLGDGIDMDFCFHSCPEYGDDFRKRFIVGGLGARF